MLFESPFYVDYPVALGISFGAFTLMALWLLVIYNRQGSFHDMVVDYFHRRQPGVPLQKWSKVGRFMFVFFALAFGTMGVYCVSVAAGVVKNKDNSVSPEQLERLRKNFEKHRIEQKKGFEE
jgi:hypothetical protein